MVVLLRLSASREMGGRGPAAALSWLSIRVLELRISGVF